MKERTRKRLIQAINEATKARQKWEDLAIKAYGIHPKQIFSPREDKFAAFIDSEDFILDLGCGNAKTLKALAEMCKGGIGIESNHTNYKIAITRFSSNKVKIIRDDVHRKLPDLAGRYTIVIMSHFLEHVEYPIKLLRQLDCKKMIILVPTFTWEYKMRGDIGMRPTRWGGKGGHYREYNKEILSKELQASSWEPEYMEYTEEEELLCFARKTK
jgi:SAM-dependent methyltransferase